MDKKDNNIRSKDDFLRYRRGEMTPEERNSFEKDLQKDPFAEEAAEGFSQITASEAEKDLSDLKHQMETRIRKRYHLIYYRLAAAASLVVLVTISVVFYNNQVKKREMTLSKNDTEEMKAPLTIAATEPLPPPTLPVIPSPSPSLSEAEVLEKEVADEVVNTDKIMADQIIAIDSIALRNDLISVEEDVVLPAEAEKRTEASRIAGVSLQTEAQSPVSAKSKSALSIVPPQPLTGLDSFNIWIEKNIRNPEPDKNIEEAVIISFKVMTDSTIANIKIIFSPGEAFSREAKRLIKEGPLWKPAMIEGKPVEDEYRITIRFR